MVFIHSELRLGSWKGLSGLREREYSLELFRYAVQDLLETRARPIVASTFFFFLPSTQTSCEHSSNYFIFPKLRAGRLVELQPAPCGGRAAELPGSGSSGFLDAAEALALALSAARDSS